MAALKRNGVLSAEANFAALKSWESGNKGGLPQPSETEQNVSNGTTASEKHLVKSREKLEFERKRQNLLRQLESGGIDINGISDDDQSASGQPHVEVSNVIAKETLRPGQESRERGALDTASSKQTPHSSKGKENVSPKIPADQSNGEVPNWRDRLMVKATECTVDGVDLSAPPFPFEQRWDPEAIKIIRERKASSGGEEKRGSISQDQADYDEVDEEELYDDGVEDYEKGDLQLNYSDTEMASDEQHRGKANGIDHTVESASDRYMTSRLGRPRKYKDADERRAVKTKQRRMQRQAARASRNRALGLSDHTDKPTETRLEDLPTLPDNLGLVPDLTKVRVEPGAIITYKQLEMSKATSWQPRVSDYRTAIVHEVLDDDLIKVRLAKRDRNQPMGNAAEDEGPREYSGFEMPGFEDDDDEEDEGFREISLGELIAPKLLRPAAHSQLPLENSNEAIMSVN